MSPSLPPLPQRRTRRPRTVRAAAALALLGALAGHLPPATGTLGHYEVARQYFERGEYEAAIIELKNALKGSPSDLPARILLGRAYLELGTGAAAEKELRTARRLGGDPRLITIPLAESYLAQGKFKELLSEFPEGDRPPEVESKIVLMRGHAFLGLRQPTNARDLFVRAAAMRPLEADPLLGQARALFALGKREAGVSLVERALVLDPDHAQAWYLKGEALRRTGDPEAAITAYGRAIALEPRMIDARIRRAALQIDADRAAAAREDLDWVRRKYPGNPQAAYLHALVLARTGDIEGAEAELQRAGATLEALPAEFRSDHPPTLLLSGIIEYQRRNFEAARGYLERYLRTDPVHLGARKMLGTILLRGGEVNEAIRTLEPAARAAPRDPQLLAVLGSAYLQNRSYSQALETLTRAAELAPEIGAIRTRLAEARLAVGQGGQAIEDLEAALAVTSGATRAGVLLVLVHLQQGEFDAAIEFARRAAEKEPENPLLPVLAGIAYWRQGDAEAARRQFEAALRLDPDLAPAQINLAAMAVEQGDLVDAEARYRAVLERDQHAAAALLGLARIAELRGDRDGEFRWLERAAGTKDASIADRLRLVEHYLRLGKLVEARELAWEVQIHNEEHPAVLAVLGRTERALGNDDTAGSVFRRLARVYMGSARGLYRTAQLQSSVGDASGAKLSLDQALKNDPTFVPALRALALLEARTDNFDEALALAGRLRADQPDLPLGEMVTGDVLMLAGRFEAALAAYTRAESKGASAALAVRLYRARLAAGRAADGLAGLETWMEGHPEDLEVLRTLGVAYIQAGRLPEAIRAHERLLVESPEDPGLLNNLAWLYLKTGDDRALGHAERAHVLHPDHPGILDTLGWILVRQGQPERGLRLLRDAQARASTLPEVRYHIAVALSKLGLRAEARDELTRLIRSGQEFDGLADARALLARLKAQ